MRQRLDLWIAVAALSGAAACATLPAPVPLVADPEGKRLLAGEWVGQYENPATGRSGSITFLLHQHADTTECRGDVLMIPRGASDPRPTQEAIGEQSAPEMRVLRIDQLTVMGDQLSGIIEPYRDPETGNPINTRFDGQIVGDRISGQLISAGGKTGPQAVGTWEVTRRNTGA